MNDGGVAEAVGRVSFEVSRVANDAMGWPTATVIIVGLVCFAARMITMVWRGL